MTMPHLENCRHSEDSWCLDCVKKQWEEFDALGAKYFFLKSEHAAAVTKLALLKNAITRAREHARANGITLRRFSEICGVTGSVMSSWTAEPIVSNPDFIDGTDDRRQDNA